MFGGGGSGFILNEARDLFDDMIKLNPFLEGTDEWQERAQIDWYWRKLVLDVAVFYLHIFWTKISVCTALT